MKSNFLEKKLKFYENVDLIANFVNVNLPLITIFLNIIVAYYVMIVGKLIDTFKNEIQCLVFSIF